MKGLISLKKIFVFSWLRLIVNPLKAIIEFINKVGGGKIIVWIYKPYRLLKKIRHKLFLPGKSKVLSMLGNRYIIHIIIIITTVFVFGLNINAKELNAQDFGKESIISNMIVEELGESTETVTYAKQISTGSNYIREGMGPVFVQYSPEYNQIEFESAATLAEGGIALIKPELVATERGIRPRDSIIEYVVQPGDTIGIIADNFSLTVSTILTENNLNYSSVIRPGQKLTILQTSGISYKIKKGDTLASIAKKYNGDVGEIIAINKLASENDISIDQKITIPGGKLPPVPKPVYASPVYTGGIPAPSTNYGTGKMAWPTSWRVITQYFSWKHTGLDIDGDYNSPIYAAEDGYIERVGWGTGYGNMVVINHGNGVKTLYAHLSKFYIVKGQTVSRGQTIGMMGTTGWSTGTHLHFEVQINGVKKNPLGYIK